MSNIKISEMAEAESLNDNDLFTIVQSGVNKKITKQNAIGDIIQAINNPTYTTTEGTDLSIDNTRVGKMKFKYYGDTEQDSYNGENLFDKDNPNILNNCVTGSGLTLDALEGCKTLYIPCKPNLTYTITKIASTRFIVVTTTDTPAIGVSTSTRSIDLTGTTITITTSSTANYLCVFYYYSGTDTLTEQEILNSIYIKIDTPIPNPNYPIEVQTATEENTITIKNEDETQSQVYEINLASRNLFDKDSPNILNAYLNANGTTTENSTFRVSDYINVSGLSDITISGNNGNSEMCCFYNENKIFISSFGMGTLTTKTVSVPNNAKYLRVTLNSSVLNQYQIEKGSTASPYKSFWQIELCDIEGHQDYIYNNGGKWFKHKEVKKQVFNGSETWTTRSVSVGQLYETTVAGFYSTTTQSLGFCNQYKANINLTNNYEFRILSGTTLALHNDDIGSVANLTTFLASNNMEVYYPLATPIEEEITEPTLINQLNAIKYGAESYYGQTNITVTSNNLQPILKVQTLDKIV